MMPRPMPSRAPHRESGSVQYCRPARFCVRMFDRPTFLAFRPSDWVAGGGRSDARGAWSTPSSAPGIAAAFRQPPRPLGTFGLTGTWGSVHHFPRPHLAARPSLGFAPRESIRSGPFSWQVPAVGAAVSDAPRQAELNGARRFESSRRAEFRALASTNVRDDLGAPARRARGSGAAVDP